MKVAILIPIFNGLDFTKKALKKIFLQLAIGIISSLIAGYILLLVS
jgi:hypothetical protein